MGLDVISLHHQHVLHSLERPHALLERPLRDDDARLGVFTWYWICSTVYVL